MNETFLKSIDEWSSDGCDERIEKALEAYEEWSNNLNVIQENQLAKLIEGFHYYTARRIDGILYNLHNQAVAKYAISNKDTVVSVVRKQNGMLGSSSDYWLRYQLVSGMSKKVFYDTLNEIDSNDWKNISKIVFIDDCSGTGETFTKFLGRQKKNLSGKLIIFLTIEMMRNAEEHIRHYANNHSLHIECLYNNLQDKALSGFSSSEVAEFVRLSKSRKIAKCDIKGYEMTEALMAFYNNTPNNTLGIFRCKTEKNTPLFPRNYEEEPGWKASKQEKGKRKKQQYIAKTIGVNNGI